ncbi:MAG TPA: hypothetical protein VN065_06105 [Bradyrhizobium sp.]|nr:hypothetical protein [Bradyrhizobium sp.]
MKEALARALIQSSKQPGYEVQIVIASEAKQSISPLDAKKAGLLRFARNDGKTRIRIPAARFRPSLANHPPYKGVGNAGRPMHPQPRVGKKIPSGQISARIFRVAVCHRGACNSDVCFDLFR